MQTVQTKIVRRRAQHLVRSATVLFSCQIIYYHSNKNENYHPTTLKTELTGPIYRIGLNWLNTLYARKCFQSDFCCLPFSFIFKITAIYGILYVVKTLHAEYCNFSCLELLSSTFVFKINFLRQFFRNRQNVTQLWI